METWTDKKEWPNRGRYVGMACDLHFFYTHYEECACCFCGMEPFNA